MCDVKSYISEKLNVKFHIRVGCDVLDYVALSGRAAFISRGCWEAKRRGFSYLKKRVKFTNKVFQTDSWGCMLSLQKKSRSQIYRETDAVNS